MKHLVAPSLLSANFANLQSDIEMLNQSEADWLHCDIMDGRFVPNISFGFPVLQAIRKHARRPLDVHLMIVEPDKYLDEFKKAGAEILTVHYEASQHLHRTVQQIKQLGMKAGVSLNPHTPVHLLENIIAELDLVLLMSVNPGFGGQTFIPETYNKIRKLQALIYEKQSKALIEVDGGVNTENAAKLLAAGANVLVAGSFVFKSENPLQTIKALKRVGDTREV